MSKKPREFWIDLIPAFSGVYDSYDQNPALMPPKDILHVVEKSAANKLVEALKYISKNGSNFIERMDIVADEALADWEGNE